MKQHSKSYQFFDKAIKRPWLIILATILIIVGAGSQLPKMQIDTTIEAFIPANHPSLINREFVRKTFGISDPVVVAISNDGKNGAFSPELLNLISELTEDYKKIEGVDPDQITSLATENNIYGTETGLVVESFIEGKIESQEDADKIKNNALNFPLYKGTLVSEDATTTLIVVELLDNKKYGSQAYFDIKKITEEKLNNSKYQGTKCYVAGEGGVVAYQATYIDGDAKKMTPLAFGVILLVLIIAYRTFRGLYLSVIVIIGSVLATMGIMAGVGVPMYLTSNIIPVILIAIGVADAIHILGEYYETLAKKPGITSREATLITMTEMWRPVTMTSVTNVAGFLAMGFTSNVPPLQMVGIFSSVGVLIALFISLFTIPAILMLLKPKLSKAYLKVSETIKPDAFGRFTQKFGVAILKKPKAIIVTSVIVIILGVFGSFQIKVDEASVEAFDSKTDIYKADRIINSKMNGSNSFDVLIETPSKEGLYTPENLKKIEKLQQYIESLPQVGGTTSIVDVIKQLNKSLNENKNEAYVIPNDKDMVAQLFLLYSSGGDPADLEQFIDYDYRLANISVSMKDGHYSSAKKVIEPLNTYIENDFNDQNVKAKVAGWMNVFYYWLDGIAFSHFFGVIVALILVLLITAFNFKSFTAGLYTVLPVFTAMLMFYAILGLANIPLNTATNIFGAIAIGVSVDFSIHIIEHLKLKIRQDNLSIEEALQKMYTSTGRALLFNAIAVCFGFGINMISELPPFVDFGALITTCVASSFLASMTLLPSMIKIFKPKFLTK
ncbi:MAG: MMPL family transporter [Saprospiraceae bacterium]|nr:MMPL family transporter [Saprospiraceae bacterium]